eukprot:m.44395 g.44395  ORF g.44395 m.44395 type:complete len:145 (-) comp5826_c0_seq1:887-1321(-)
MAAVPQGSGALQGDSTSHMVKYLGRIRLQKKPTSAACVEALDGLRADVGLEHGIYFSIAVSSSRGFIHAAGTQGEMKHPLFQIVCVTTVDQYLCYALAIPVPTQDTTTPRKYLFSLHGFEVRSSLDPITLPHASCLRAHKRGMC